MPRLAYRRPGSRWSAEKIAESGERAERKALAAVRCRGLVRPHCLLPLNSVAVLPCLSNVFHHVVLNVKNQPKTALVRLVAVIRCITRIYHELRQSAIGIPMPGTAKLLNDSIDSCWISHMCYRLTNQLTLLDTAGKACQRLGMSRPKFHSVLR
jgi:hypothetical protein